MALAQEVWFYCADTLLHFSVYCAILWRLQSFLVALQLWHKVQAFVIYQTLNLQRTQHPSLDGKMEGRR